MNTATKLIQAMQQNPRDWRIEQLQTVARHYGLTYRHEGGSHCYFIRADGQSLSVPAHRPVKPIYIKKFLVLVQGA